MNLSDNDPYSRSFKDCMDKHSPGLWGRLDAVPTLPVELQSAVVDYIVELACLAQNERNITIGREALQELPRQWLIGRLPSSIERVLDLDDEWEFRRLCEALKVVDRQVLCDYVGRVRNSSNGDVREAAREFDVE